MSQLPFIRCICRIKKLKFWKQHKQVDPQPINTIMSLQQLKDLKRILNDVLSLSKARYKLEIRVVTMAITLLNMEEKDMTLKHCEELRRIYFELDKAPIPVDDDESIVIVRSRVKEMISKVLKGLFEQYNLEFNKRMLRAEAEVKRWTNGLLDKAAVDKCMKELSFDLPSMNDKLVKRYQALQTAIQQHEKKATPKVRADDEWDAPSVAVPKKQSNQSATSVDDDDWF